MFIYSVHTKSIFLKNPDSRLSKKQRVSLDNRYTTPAEPQIMGACPYCRSATLPGDTICYSCGRVLPKGDRGSYRLEQQFSKRKGAKDTTYKMATQPSQLSLIHI